MTIFKQPNIDGYISLLIRDEMDTEVEHCKYNLSGIDLNVAL